ncbi:Ig-like domain-containing protein [Massilia sp. NR 4-1]|uniref:Ig-like domain-containing protein n=1 Tax=Massilia sp. NR 4-1 TaxID=1678028 RepID=UPI000A896A53|nr:Ig-like domain-containing protein [Massilia sp. NR 4-1]
MSEIPSTVLSDSQPSAKGRRLARSSQMLALEQRFMFDGALAASAADAASHPDGDRAPEHQAGQIDAASLSDSARIRSYAAALVATRFDLSGTTGSGGQTVRQTVDGHTMVLTSTKTIMTVEDESALGEDVVGMEGMILLPAGGGDTETKIRISVAGGKIFDLGSLTIFDRNEINQDLKITTDKGSAPLAQQFNASHTWIPSFSGSMYEGVSWVEIEAKDGNEFVWMFDNFVLNNIRLAASTPTVTDGKISITSTGSGTGGAYKIGDTVTARWDNSAGGDNNASLNGVTMDFSAFGGGTAVSATQSGGIWTASYTITAGSIDMANRNVSVSAANASGTTTTADSSNLTVDNIAPTLTDAKISISGGSGAGGAYKIGDTVTVSWNNTAGGDNNSDTISSVQVDFSQFGGGSAVTATNSGGTWSATYTIVAGSIDDVANRNVSVTVKDNAGNQTTTSDSSNARVDNVAPAINISALSFSNDTGASASDFITRTAAQTITATLSAALSGTEKLYGSLDNGTSWLDISSKVTGTALSWDGVTLAASSTLLLKVKDGAGNEGPLKSQAYILDSSAPATPSVPDLDSGSDSGGSNSDNLTSSVTPTFSGSADAGSTVTLYDSNGVTELGSTTADGAGKWSITASTMSSGSHTVTAKASDAAGNVSAASAGLTVEIDTAPPASLGLSTTSLSSVAAGSGATVATLSASDAHAFSFSLATGDGANDVHNGRFTISGSTLKVGGSALVAGTYSIYVAATDAAGNKSYQVFSIVVADQPSVSSIVRGNSEVVPANASSIVYTVTFSENVTGVDASDFTLSATGTAAGSIASVTAIDGKTYTVLVNALGGDGTLRLDLKGSGTGIENASHVAVGAYSAGQTYTLDRIAPAAPSAPDLDSASDSGSLDSDNLTRIATPVFTGTAEANSTVTLYDSNGSTVLGSATADGAGKWSITASTMSAGSHTVTAKATDAAGNISAASAALTVVIDQAAPASVTLSAASIASAAATSGASVATLTASDDHAVSYALTAGDGSNDAQNGRFAISGGTLKVGATTLTAGTYKVYVAATDAAGNVSKQAFTITVLDAPSVSSIDRSGGASAAVAASATSISYTVSFSENVTGVDASDFTLSATGTAAGSIASVMAVDGKTYTVLVNGLGGDGVLRLDLKGSGTGIKSGGNVDIGGGYGSGQSYTLDHSAPAAPSAPDLKSSSDSGSSDSDNITSSTTPTFTGTAEANSTVTLYDSNGSTVLGSATADGSGNWSITASTMSAGSHTVTAKATDAVGNVSAASAALTVEIDVAAPSTLVLSSSSIASLTATSGATVATLTASDDHAVSYALASGDGSNDAQNSRFAISGGTLKVGATALTAGTYHIYLAATDAAGNVSKYAFTINVVDAPAVSSIERSGGVAAGVAASTSSVSYTVTFSENVTGVDAGDFTLNGTGTASGTIASVTAIDGKTYAVVVNSLGGDGALRLDLKGSGTGIKGGGNVDIGGGYSAGQSYTLDRVAPAAPSAPDMKASSDSGVADSDNITSSTTPTFTGTAEVGSTVKLYDTDGTTLLGSATADGSGNWSITASTMSAGSHTVTAKAVDAAGNVSAASAALSVNIDTVAPTALALSTNTVALSSAVSAATVATLSATDSNAVGYALVSGDGSNDADNARFTLAGNALKVGGTALTAGSYKVYLAATDAAGNVTKQAFVINVTEKPPAPPAPVVASIERSGGAAETVASGAQEIRYTVVFSQDVSGVDAGDFILSASGTAGGSIASVSGSGSTYTVTVSGLAGEGTLRLDLKSGGTGIQNAGKVDIGGGFAAGQSYLLDRVAPPAPSMPDLAGSSDSGSSDSDNLTSSTTPVFTGTAQAGSSVTLYDGSVAIGSAVADAKGNWSITSSPLAAGAHSVTARASDAAGNASAASAALTVVIDTQAPAALSLSANSIALAAAGSNALVATLSASDSHAVSYALAAGDGANDADNGRFTLSGGTLKIGGTALTAGSYRIYVAATDAAGNTTKQAFTVTVAMAVAPVVKSIERSGEAAGGSSISYVVTFSENVSGVDAGDFVLTADGNATGTIAGVSGSGSTYIVTVTGMSGEGSLRLDLKDSGTGIQNAGNVALASGFTSGQSYTLNNVVPPDVQVHLPSPPVNANTVMAPAPAAVVLAPPATGNAIFLSRSAESVLGVSSGLESERPLQAALAPLLTMGQGTSFQVLLKESQFGTGLMLNRPLADQFVPAAGTMQFSVPTDTFAHSSRDAVIRLSAVQVNGAPIPDWVSFDARSGKFTVRAPAGVAGELQIKVTARDAQGNEATTLLKIRVGGAQQAADAAPRSGRPGLSEQLRASGGRPALERAVRR